MLKGEDPTSASPNISSELTPAKVFYLKHAVWSYDWVHGPAFKTIIERSDIFYKGWENLRTRLFPDGKEMKCKFENPIHEINFIKQALRNAHIDLIRKQQRESHILSRISLDAPIQNDDGESQTQADVIGAPDKSLDEVMQKMCNLLLAEDVKAVIDGIPNPLHRLVALSDLGYVEKDQLKDVNPGIVRVARGRYLAYLRKSVLVKYKDWMK